MASASSSSINVNQKFDPWAIEVVTPSESLIAMFEKNDKTKSSSSRLRAFNRAKKWQSKVFTM